MEVGSVTVSGFRVWPEEGNLYEEGSKMVEFKASNGYVITDIYKSLEVRLGVVDYQLPWSMVEALREYFQAKRDEELGRWRDPEYPDYVVYKSHIFGEGTVPVTPDNTYKESYIYSFEEATRKANNNIPARVALNYLAAHPKPAPKSWHNVDKYEVWELKIDHDSDYLIGVSTGEGIFFNPAMQEYIDQSEVIDARRIHPKEDQGE